MSEVAWSPRAQRAHRRLYRYLLETEPAAAVTVGRRLFDAGMALGDHPTGRPGRHPRTYEKSLPDINYILLYRIQTRGRDDVVLILDIVHGRRNWPEGQMPPR